MRSRNDPITLWRRRRLAALGLGGLAVAISVVWAFLPLPDPPMIDATLARPAAAPEGGARATPLDREAFSARIWNPPRPPQPQPTAVAERPAPPLKLQLIGILHDAAESGAPLLRAALYDPDSDRLLFVASGERIGPTTVTSIDAEGVSLESAGRTNRLALREPDPGLAELDRLLRRAEGGKE